MGNSKAINLKIGEKTYTLETLTVDQTLELMDYNVKLQEGDLDPATREGFLALMEVLVIFFDNEEITIETLRKADIQEIMKAFTIQKINAWFESLGEDDENTENGSAEKKDLPQPEKQETQS